MKITKNKLKKLIKEEMEVMFRPNRNDDEVFEKGDMITVNENEYYILGAKSYNTEDGEVTSYALKLPEGRHTYRVIMKEDGSFSPIVPTHTVQGWLV